MQQNPNHLGVLQIEPTDLCNLSCTMCAPHHEGWAQVHGVPKGRMPLSRYKRIVDHLVADDCHFDHLIFQWLGDPSVHPELEQMLAYAQDRLHDRVGYLRVDTNAILLTPERMDRLVALYARRPELPLLMVFTLDAASAATYQQVKGQDALDRVRRHVRRFLMQRAKLPFDDVRLNVELQFVLQQGNAHELGAFVDYWDGVLRCYGEKGHSELMIKRLSVGAGGQAQREADALYERSVAQAGLHAERRPHMELKLWEASPWEAPVSTPTPAQRPPCPGLWVTPVIRHDGHLVMCCADLASELDLGPVHERGFRALWEGEIAVQRRLAHLEGRHDEVGPCGDCGGIQWYSLREEQIAATRARAR